MQSNSAILLPLFDAILVVGFGGPERPDDVMPFLENVLRGRNVPRERMLEVAAHYEHFKGKSPLNDQMRALIGALRVELAAHGINLPIYWGNRNWHPLLADALREMTAAGVQRAICYVASAYASYSSCRQYLGNIDTARQSAGPTAPLIDKLRLFFNHPLFIAANAARLNEAVGQVSNLPTSSSIHIAFTAHSIPLSMARTSQYERQLLETCRLTAAAAGIEPRQWQLCYQSRSGRPEDPWLEPDILDHLRKLASQIPPPSEGRGRGGATCAVVIMPIGFLSDHIEVLYDLDYEARHVCDELGLSMVRAQAVGTHPLFVQMIRELIEERLSGTTARLAVGEFPAWPDVCPAECCPGPRFR